MTKNKSLDELDKLVDDFYIETHKGRTYADIHDGDIDKQSANLLRKRLEILIRSEIVKALIDEHSQLIEHAQVALTATDDKASVPLVTIIEKSKDRIKELKDKGIGN